MFLVHFILHIYIKFPFMQLEQFINMVFYPSSYIGQCILCLTQWFYMTLLLAITCLKSDFILSFLYYFLLTTVFQRQYTTLMSITNVFGLIQYIMIYLNVIRPLQVLCIMRLIMINLPSLLLIQNLVLELKLFIIRFFYHT